MGREKRGEKCGTEKWDEESGASILRKVGRQNVGREKWRREKWEEKSGAKSGARKVGREK